jgi:hypothetical protein
MAPEVKDPKTRKNCQNEPVGIGGRPPKSIWINPSPLVQKMPCFDNSIKLDPLMASALDLFVHNLIIGFLLYPIGVGL